MNPPTGPLTDHFSDTIVAISTPPGISGIGIVRLSGPRAAEIAASVFRPAHPRKAVAEQPTYSLLYGHVMDGEERVDEALLTVMRAPHTYTTQDVVEINCHGGLIPLRRTLSLCLDAGARLADPGEFTQRAFFFGRIDLAQAEAVADLITARTAEAARAALSQLGGRLSAEIERLRQALVNVLAELEAQLDFGEDLEPHAEPAAPTPPLSRGGPPPQGAGWGPRLASLASEVAALLATAAQGKLLRQGARVALAGRPNVGKSSLMNALLGEERMIVTAIPGTTRDTVEESLNLQGVPVVLVDTAGLREVKDEVEQAGVDRARQALNEADVILLLLDRSAPLQSEDEDLLETLAGPRTLVVLNKCDLPPASPSFPLYEADRENPVEISALTHAGLDRLRGAIAERIGLAGEHAAEIIVTNARHQQALEHALVSLQRAQSSAQAGATEEYLAEDLRAALSSLGQITGATSPEEIVNQIFALFCVGK
jgi:tRNA modification GTPase